MIERRSEDHSVDSTLSIAMALIEARDFHAAIGLYSELLDTDLAGPVRGEVLTNYATALCLLAEAQPGPEALTQLDKARELLIAALPYRQRREAPVGWATTRANLALVYLTRYRASDESEELLAAHLALDGIEEALRNEKQTGLREWVTAIRDQLVDLRERRNAKR